MEILFDLDGTLTDSGPGITRCIQDALRRLGRAVPEADSLRRFVGPPLRGTFALLLESTEEAEVAEALHILRRRAHETRCSMTGMTRFALAVLAVTASAPVAAAPPAEPAAQRLPSVLLPPELDRVLRDYEKAWQARDAAGLAALFAEDGFVLASNRPPVRGREAIRAAYAGAGGPLVLRALAYSTQGPVGYVIGAFGRVKDGEDSGKFVLALRRGDDGRWLIAADMDNSNRRPSAPPAAATPAATPRPR